MKTILIAGALVVAGIFSGCAIDAAGDCRNICTRYHDCYDRNYNTMACEDRCRTNAINDPDYKNKSDECDRCLGDTGCATSFGCGLNCAGIVP